MDGLVNDSVAYIKGRDFFTRLKELSFVEKIILYGSRARGDNAVNSDIDIAIICPQGTNHDWFTAMDIVDNADTLLAIDCVRFDSLSDESTLKQSIEKEGIVLYEK